MEPATQRYNLKNLDCAACAAKIETGLSRLEGVQNASIDFANLTLHVKASNIQKVLEEIRRIDPHIEPVPADGIPRDSSSEKPRYDLGREFTILAMASALFLVHLTMEETLHRLGVPSLELALVLAAYLLAGWNVLTGAFRTIHRGDFFDENVLMVIATGGAIAIHAMSEAIGVMIFFKIGELLQERAVSRSRRSIRALLAARPDRALVKTNNGLTEMPPEQVAVGDVIVVRPGEKIPLDGEVMDGVSQVDTSPLTGEPVPKKVGPGDAVMAGAINDASALFIRVSKPFKESSISRVLDLVESAAARKAGTEKFITTFARYYTPVVVAMAAAVATVPPLLIEDARFSTWIYRALVLLVISCPCALVVSIPLGYFGGIGRASHRGVLVKGSNFIDALAQIDTIVFDKTGTLTLGVFELDKIVPLNGFDPDQLLFYAAAAELHSDHPIAKSVLSAATSRGLSIEAEKIGDHEAINGMGVRAIVDGREVLVGNDALLHQKRVSHDRCEFDRTVAHIVVDGSYAGYLLVGDRIKPDAHEAVSRLRKSGMKHLAMLTGDNACAAAHVADTLGLDAFHADLFPEDKVRVLEEIIDPKDPGSKVAYVGDGINDAPVLARADVGVAMGALGSDAAIETADVVLMTDSPAKMAEAVSIAKATRKIVWQNIVLALGVKGVFVAFGAFGLASMWEAVFADMGTALLAVFNSTRALGGRQSRV